MNVDNDPILQRLQIQFKENLPDHSVDTVIDAAKDLKQPNPEDLKLYFDYYYGNYNEESLGELYHILDQMLDARSSVETDLRELGFDFHMDTLFTGIEIMKSVVSAVQNIYQQISWNDNREKSDIEEHCYRELLSSTEYILLRKRMEKREELLLGDFEVIWEAFMKMLESELTQLDFEKEASELEDLVGDLLSKHDVAEEKIEGRRSNRRLQTHTYTIKEENEEYECSIGEQMTFIRRFLEIFSQIDLYLEEVEGHRPDAELVEQIERDRLKYGAKAAHLMFLQSLIDAAKLNREKQAIATANASLEEVSLMVRKAKEGDIKDSRGVLESISALCYTHELGDDFFQFEVPSAVYVEAGLYDRWDQGEKVDDELRECFNSAKGFFSEVEQESTEVDDLLAQLSGNAVKTGEVAIRSSAVHSEDGENHTGAGIYHSALNVPLDSFKAFKNGIISVWESTNTEEARLYRESIGVEKESMGVIIQPQIDEATHVQINSTKPHFSTHAEALIDDVNVVVMQKRLLILDIIDRYGLTSGMFSEHSRVDWRDAIQKMTAGQMADLMRIADTMERLLGKSVQLEILLGGTSSKVVQLRPLPILEPINVPEFPNVECLYKGRGVGVGVKKIRKEDLPIGQSSLEATIGNAVVRPHNVGRHEALVMTNSFAASAGHIEQQCLEQGIILITNDPLSPMEFPYHNLPDNLVVISNGFEGRIYDAALLD